MKTLLFAVAVVMTTTSAVHADEADPSPAAPAEMEHGFAPALAAVHIADIQQRLTARGYYAGPVDGRISPSLWTAISVYQSDVSMRVTGIADLAVLNMLKFGPDVKATIQPLGGYTVSAIPFEAPPVEAAPAPVPAARARSTGVPPYEAPKPHRYPKPDPLFGTPQDKAATTDRSQRARPQKAVKPLRVEDRSRPKPEEPPLPKAAPRHKVESSPLPPESKGSSLIPHDFGMTKL